ncbi:unnamed protein product [Diabrotica balteata]|uniref:Uncharacterized protein n=1 Tax=Diabrotica balteata TaxID=107213 RepID=A0A9N9X9I1_DIABA|nr:unnamed protein product [Diabrotica balteata]
MRLVSGSLKLRCKSCTFFVVIIYLFNLALGSEECSDKNLKAFENELQFPCREREDSKAESVLGEALQQLFILNRYLNSTLFDLEKLKELPLEYISDGRTCSKVTTMLTRLENEKKTLLESQYSEEWQNDPNLDYFKNVLHYENVPKVPEEDDVYCQPLDNDIDEEVLRV